MTELQTYDLELMKPELERLRAELVAFINEEFGRVNWNDPSTKQIQQHFRVAIDDLGFTDIELMMFGNKFDRKIATLDQKKEFRRLFIWASIPGSINVLLETLSGLDIIEKPWLIQFVIILIGLAILYPAFRRLYRNRDFLNDSVDVKTEGNGLAPEIMNLTQRIHQLLNVHRDDSLNKDLEWLKHLLATSPDSEGPTLVLNEFEEVKSEITQLLQPFIPREEVEAVYLPEITVDNTEAKVVTEEAVQPEPETVKVS